MDDKAQEPVAWMYRVNNTYTQFDTEKPPNDAYDNETLIPLYTHPAPSKEQDEFVFICKHCGDKLGIKYEPKEQEPVAWVEKDGFLICPELDYESTFLTQHPKDLGWIPLYPHPAPRQEQELAAWEHFDKAYQKACKSSQPQDWMDAALLAQQVRNTHPAPSCNCKDKK